MAEEKKTIARKKPKFLRVEWHKKIKLGKGVKKNQRWHGAKGRHNKLRLNRKGRAAKPRVGWGSSHEIKNKVSGVNVVRVENVKMLDGLKDVGIMIGKIGKKKRMEIIAKANKMKLKILNKYRGKQNEFS